MKKAQASILLICVFAARGTSFLFSKELMNTMLPMSVLAVRFLLAFLILALIFIKKLLNCDKRSLRGGLILGVLYTVCMIFEMYGLRLIDSGTSSLIENMAIVLVPLYVAVLTKSLPKKKTMLCAALAVIGVGFLSLAQGGVSAAITYAACILATERVSQNADPVTIGVIQLGVMGVLSLLIALLVGGFSLPKSADQWGLMALLVLLCSCFGFAFQPVGQKYLPAETAAIITVVNPLTASVLGIVAAGETVSVPKIIGYVLILFSLLLYQADLKRLNPSIKKNKGDHYGNQKSDL